MDVHGEVRLADVGKDRTYREVAFLLALYQYLWEKSPHEELGLYMLPRRKLSKLHCVVYQVHEFNPKMMREVIYPEAKRLAQQHQRKVIWKKKENHLKVYIGDATAKRFLEGGRIRAEKLAQVFGALEHQRQMSIATARQCGKSITALAWEMARKLGPDDEEV
jgi:hypothetical protein